MKARPKILSWFQSILWFLALLSMSTLKMPRLILWTCSVLRQPIGLYSYVYFATAVSPSTTKFSHSLSKSDIIFCIRHWTTWPTFNKFVSGICLQVYGLLTANNDGPAQVLYEPSRDKTNKMTCAQRRHRSAWASAQSNQSLRCPHEETMGP